MSTLLIHFLSDFLRDNMPDPNNLGEKLRCKVLDDEISAFTEYGLTGAQIGQLVTRDRQKIMQAVFDEIGPAMDEVADGGGKSGIKMMYPGGSVHLREVVVATSNGSKRLIMVRGTGFSASPSVEFQDGAGNTIQGVVLHESCDPDVWQRLQVSVDLPAGTYTVTVRSQTGPLDTTTLVVP